jgi:hypothetical protein
MTMPQKNANTERFGGPGSSRQDRRHPEKGGREHEAPAPGAPTSGRQSKCQVAGVSETSITHMTTATEVNAALVNPGQVAGAADTMHNDHLRPPAR